MEASICLFLKLPGLYLIVRSTVATIVTCFDTHAVLDVEATGGLGSWAGSKLLIDLDAPAMVSATDPCVFRCK